MSDLVEASDDSNISITTLTLDEALVVQQIEQKLEEMHQVIEQVSEIKLDLTKLQQVDTSGYQLFISLVKYCEKHSKSLYFSDITDEFRNTLILFGDEILINKIATN